MSPGRAAMAVGAGVGLPGLASWPYQLIAMWP